MVKAKKIEITQEELKEVLDYNSETGVFRWNIYRASNAKAGDIAGGLQNCGYCVIQYKRKIYTAHRLAWLYFYGELSEDKFVDHIDRDKTNNRISNLRLCTNSENQKNRKKNSNNTSGYKGVYWNKAAGKWVVRPKLNGIKYYLGYYIDKEEAIAAYQVFCIQHHGEFYRDTTT